MTDLVSRVAQELSLPQGGVNAVLALAAEGATVPFIARYRKEQTGALDEVQIRDIILRHAYGQELEERRAAILASVREQGALTPELERALLAATTKLALEDLYAPYRPRRRTRGMAAREKGLAPLAALMRAQGPESPMEAAVAFVSTERGVAHALDALAGARDIVAEEVADTASVRAFVRRVFSAGQFASERIPGKGEDPTKYELYYAHREPVATIPSHRFLAIRRGESEGILRARIEVDVPTLLAQLSIQMGFGGASLWRAELQLALEDGYRRLLAPTIENEVRSELKERSDAEATRVFAENLHNLLLAPPLGAVPVIGVDPGLRTGCKCAAIAATGEFQETVTLYLSQGDAEKARAKDAFLAFVTKHAPRAIAVGNGTGGREAEVLLRSWLHEAGQRDVAVVSVNEAGASVYSASDIAREEFPELDLTIRGAISIGRRLQDPLAELVKIDPKSIGVGQYQHDVNETMLGARLTQVVESCVNRVGVDLNTASAALLSYVAGIGPSLAKKIVDHRASLRGFSSRAQLHDVASLGPKTFEQAAGFLRIRGGAEPLDASAVHPERYEVVRQMAARAGVPVTGLLGNTDAVKNLPMAEFADVGQFTLVDLTSELLAPGRDPREAFSPPAFRADVTAVEHLQPGMQLEGIVTNVTAFGAFVDVGVHQDGLVHITRLSKSFVKNPADVVKVGQKISVRVVEVDVPRKRISLSCLAEADERARAAVARGNHAQHPTPAGDKPAGGESKRGGRGRGRGPRNPASGGPADRGADRIQSAAPAGSDQASDGAHRRADSNQGPRQPRDGGPSRGPRGDGPRRHGGNDDRGGRGRGPGERPAHSRGNDERDNRGGGNGRPPRRDDRGHSEAPREARRPDVGLNEFRANPFAALLKK